MDKIYNINWQTKHRELEYKLDYLKDEQLLSLWSMNGIQKDQTKIYLHQMIDPYDWMNDVVKQIIETNSLKYPSFAFHKIPPGNFLGMHSDKYGLFRKKHHIQDINKIKRIIVFLEDAVDGHILIVGNNSYINWKKGESVSWVGDQKHLAANLGLQDRYTFQITGLMDD